MSIYVTGDTHGELARFSNAMLPFAKTWNREDYLIICGDFGFVFTGTIKEQRVLDRLAMLPYHILFVDGNHECFPRIESLPVEVWNGGKIHRIRENVLHLMRGQIFDLCGVSLFTFGGGYSIDKDRRVEGRDWWARELPSAVEYEEAIQNLASRGNAVDYIITHAGPLEPVNKFFRLHPAEAELIQFLRWVRDTVTYRHWYFGHLHRDENLWGRQSVLWFDTKELISGKVCSDSQ